jgi:hypothetical protein
MLLLPRGAHSAGRVVLHGQGGRVAVVIAHVRFAYKQTNKPAEGQERNRTDTRQSIMQAVTPRTGGFE